MTTARTFDNLVIGGGPAGAMAALRLARAGCEVLLLEKERGAHHKVCGEFLSPEAVAYLSQTGIDPVRLGAVAIHRLRVSSRDRIIETNLPFAALSLSRCALDAALLVRAEEEGCMVRRGVAVQQLAQSMEGWIAELSDGTSQRAHTVFLGTGKHDLRGWSRPPGAHADLVGFKLHWRLTPGAIDELRGSMDLFLFSGGYGGLSLIEGDAANLCLVVRRSRLRRLGGWPELLSALREENRLIRQRLEGARPLWGRPLAISPIPYGYLAGRKCGLWCVGDQAAVIPSFTGDGMAIALHSGSLAAAMHLDGQSPAEYYQALKAQLTSGMWLATVLSRSMVGLLGPSAVPLLLTLFPKAAQWIASSTRIPKQALVPGPGIEVHA